MYNKTEVMRHLSAAQEHLYDLYTRQGKQFDPEALEALLESLSEAVDAMGLDLTHVSGNDFEHFSEFAYDYAVHHQSAEEGTISDLHTQILELQRIAQREVDETTLQADMLDPTAQFIMNLAVLVFGEFEDNEEDLLSELSVFDDGIDEVDDDAEPEDDDWLDLPY